ncbi:MAG: hypothetical protein RLZZ450_467 [Pseudomonadota bacterium]|jgi:hypothetical protein
MPVEASSLHLRNAHELFLLIPIKHGFVEGPDRRTSYASRLHTLLNMLFAGIAGSAEKTLMPRASFADVLQNIYHFHYGVVDRLQGSQLILSATFDSSWETYFRNLVDGVGPILDAVFSHCQGFEGRSCADGYEAFADFIREHQVQAGILYAATPDSTYDDLRMLRGGGNERPFPSPLDVAEREEKVWRERYRSSDWQGRNEPGQGTDEFTRLRIQSVVQFVFNLFEIYKLFPDKEKVDAKRSARAVFKKAVLMLLDSIPKEDFSNALAALPPTPGPDDHVDEDTRELTSLIHELGSVVLEPPDPNDHDSGLTRSQEGFRAANVQDNILTSCGSTEGMLVLLRFPAGKTAELIEKLRAVVEGGSDALRVNVGFTYAGLRRAGLEDGTLELFPAEFREGMEKRAGALGDVGWPNHPDYWHELDAQGRKFSLSSIDLVALFHRKSDPKVKLVAKLVDVLHPWWERPDVVVHYQLLEHRAVDHFGYRSFGDGNQPKLPDATVKVPAPPEFDNHIAAGDIFLGHPDTHGEKAQAADHELNPYSSALFRDGTFLVVRKLAQDPAAFAEFLKKTHRSKESVLGRPELTGKDGEANADPVLTKDLDSHVRRVNPRNGVVPRILRRSFSYERDAEKGHMFIAYNASIAQQYEVLQRWINGGNSTGIPSSSTDPLASQHTPRHDNLSKTHKSHVNLRWGMYLFVPSRAALAELVVLTGTDDHPKSLDWSARLQRAEKARLVARGESLIKQLDAVSDSQVARLSWKQLLEEASKEEDSRAVWAAIRAAGGRKETPYGLLVGDRKGVETVLGDDGSRFSVHGYRNRLIATAGDFYLGIDVGAGCPHLRRHDECKRSYRELSRANEVLRDEIKVAQLAKDAAQHVQKFFAPFGNRVPYSFDLRDLAREVVGKIARDHIGLPPALHDDMIGLRKFLDHFIYITRYMSFPYPEDWVAEQAIDSGKKLRKAYGQADPKSWGGIAPALLKADYGNAVTIREAVIGANIGFVPPAVSMLVGTMVKWIENGDLEHPRVLTDLKTLRAALIHDLRTDPTFPNLFRTAVEGNGMTTAGTHVIVGLQSAYEEDTAAGRDNAYEWLFGGHYVEDREHATHACPMATQALDALSGALMALGNHIRATLQGDSKRTLVRLGPARYGFDVVKRILPGIDLK